MELKLEPGAKARVDKTVEYKDTAKAVASGLAEVFATPSMIALMENAAYLAVQPLLPEGTSTVGVRIDAKHIAATPVGLKVWAEAVLAEADGRRLTFDIEAFDEKEKIGEARHERFVIDEQKFISRVQAKGIG
jgi:fluoroacetyl-CoA thioesterase